MLCGTQIFMSIIITHNSLSYKLRFQRSKIRATRPIRVM